jgi:hypothetical protein
LLGRGWSFSNCDSSVAYGRDLVFLLGQSQWGFIRVLWVLIMLMWHHINEERW